MAKTQTRGRSAATSSSTAPGDTARDRVRIQLDFTKEAYAELMEIERLANARTHAEAIRRALNLFRWFLKHKNDRPTLTIHPDGAPVREFVPLEV